MSGHVFVDETKARDYLLVAVAIENVDLKSARSTIRSLLVTGAIRDARTSICLEHDDSMIQVDRSVLIAVTKAHRAENNLQYRHDRAASEPLLALPDAVAWAWARGGEWRPRCEGMVTKVIDT